MGGNTLGVGGAAAVMGGNTLGVGGAAAVMGADAMGVGGAAAIVCLVAVNGGTDSGVSRAVLGEAAFGVGGVDSGVSAVTSCVCEADSGMGSSASVPSPPIHGLVSVGASDVSSISGCNGITLISFLSQTGFPD